MSETQKSPQDNTNIFEDFIIDKGLKEEVKRQEEKQKKDIFYFLSKVTFLMGLLNILLIFFIILGYSYILIQKSEQRDMYNFLDPFCFIFVGRSDIHNSSCSSVQYTLNRYNNLIQEEEAKQARLLGSTLVDAYILENFFSSRKVNFILNTSASRLKPLEILKDFDALQSQFVPIDKLEVHCPNITMQGNGYIEFNCVSYSSPWDPSLNVFQDGILRSSSRGGTSISKAANFIDFIENAKGSPFRIIERPMTFTSQDVQFGEFLKRTNFRFIAEYQSDNFNLLK